VRSSERRLEKRKDNPRKESGVEFQIISNYVRRKK
jgi:hypothetical protein